MESHPFKQYREKYDLTQIDLAHLLDISHASISRIETGGQTVTIEIAERAERKLGIPRLQLLYPNPPAKTKKHIPFSQKIKNFFQRRSRGPTKPEF